MDHYPIDRRVFLSFSGLWTIAESGGKLLTVNAYISPFTAATGVRIPYGTPDYLQHIDAITVFATISCVATRCDT
jgi:hypothetical protein